jgi:hypothetical protein
LSDSSSTLLNFSFINWVVLSLMLAIVFTTWRNIPYLYNTYNNFFVLILFLLFFVFFFKIF